MLIITFPENYLKKVNWKAWLCDIKENAQPKIVSKAGMLNQACQNSYKKFTKKSCEEN